MYIKPKYSLAVWTSFYSVRSVSEKIAKLSNGELAGLVTQALEQGRLGSCVHARYHQYYICADSEGPFDTIVLLEH